MLVTGTRTSPGSARSKRSITLKPVARYNGSPGRVEHELERAKAGRASGADALGHELPPQPPARHRRVHEERADARRFGGGVEQRVRTGLRLVSPE